MFAVMDAVTQVPAPVNEPVLDYAPGSPERAELQVALAELGSSRMDLQHVIGGERVSGTGKKIEVRQPHAHKQVLGTMREATTAEAEAITFVRLADDKKRTEYGVGFGMNIDQAAVRAVVSALNRLLAPAPL